MRARRHIVSSAAACFLTAIFVSACGKVDATEHARQGNEYFDQEKYAEAIVEFRGALQEDPKLGAVRLKLGDSYIRTKDFRNALREYVRAADLLPNDIDAQVKAGELLLMAGAFEDVKARADAALALDPKHTKAQILRGNALAGLKDLDGAMSEFEQAVAIDPTETGAYASIGALQFAKGRIEDAEATFKKAVETAPESVEALLGLANFYWASKRPQESEEAMKSALLIDPKNVVANRALGLLYMGTGRANEAEPFFVAIANASSDAAGKLALADYYAMVKRPEDSRKLLRELSGEEASYAVATTRLAALDAAAGNRAQAQAILNELLVKHPKDAPALLLHARLLVADNKREDALAPLKTVIAGDPGSPSAAQAYFITGQIHASTDRIKEAIESFEQVLKLQPRPLAADLALARLHLATGATDKSMTYARQALAIQPDNPDARALLIRNYVRRGERAKAKEDLAVLQKAFPSSPGVHNLEALIHLANRELDAARASYTRTVQLSPNDAEATAGLLGLDIATGHAKEASARLDEGLSRGTPTASALLLAARTYAMAGDVAKTETALRQAIEVDPSRSQAYGMLGQLYFSQKRLAEAEESFREVTRRNPNSMAAGTMLGMLLQQQGNAPEAEKEYLRVLSIDSRAAVAANNLAWMYLEATRLDEALQLAQTAQQQLPNDPRVSDTLGWIYFKKNMLPVAIQQLESSVEKAPKDATFKYHLGMAYKQAGSWDKARKSLKEALSLSPSFDGADEAKQALSIIGA